MGTPASRSAATRGQLRFLEVEVGARQQNRNGSGRRKGVDALPGRVLEVIRR